LTAAEDIAPGRRIAAARKRRGLSQRELGAILDRSETWVSQVERGVRTIDRMSVIERVAEVLDIPASELAGGSAVAAPSAPEDQRAASDLALALVSSISLRAAVDSSNVDGTELAAEAVRAWEYAHSSAYEQLGELLLGLLPEMETAARAASGDESRRAYHALAKAYHAAAAVLSKMSQTSAAWVAVERAIAAAEKSGDPLLMAEGAFRLTLVFQGARWLDLAQRTASSAVDALERLDSQSIEARSLAGALRLQLAIISARSDDAAIARGFGYAAPDHRGVGRCEVRSAAREDSARRRRGARRRPHWPTRDANPGPRRRRETGCMRRAVIGIRISPKPLLEK